MITFADGPAAGVMLSLERAPLLLRAVQARNGEWDALDQLSDEPKSNEAITVYRRASRATLVHVLRRPRSRSGWYRSAVYHVLVDADQPPDDVTRDTAAWRRWCLAVVSGENHAEIHNEDGRVRSEGEVQELPTLAPESSQAVAPGA